MPYQHGERTEQKKENQKQHIYNWFKTKNKNNFSIYN